MKGDDYMKKNLVINTVLYFILYSIALSVAWFEYGFEYPTVEGIGFIWIFPAVYLMLLLISLRLAFFKVEDASSFLTMGIGTIGFISVLWGVSALVRLGGADYQLREILYPASLFIISLLVFVLYVHEYAKAKGKKQK